MIGSRYIRQAASPRRALGRLAVVVAALSGFSVLARRRGYSGFGGNTVVRCRDGHLFTTIWVPGASLKSVKLGWKRYQRCPVANHWSFVTPVKESELSEDELTFAREHRDIRIP